MFTKGPAVSFRFAFFGLIALALVLISLYTDWLDPVRRELSTLAKPFYQITDVPRRISDWSDETFVSRAALVQEKERLASELLIHQRKLQQMAALAAENVRLRQLLNATEILEDDVLVAELIGVSPNPLSHTLVLNRGSDDGVSVGQPVLDAKGLMGQVIEVGPDSARVLLLTDPSHALPVQVNRNGIRTIAEGTGSLDSLTLRHVSNTTDIRVGDLLVSSGLGQRFPAGYPVAVVEKIERDPGQPFAQISARPMAQMDRTRNVLLVFEAPQVD
ncbi:rod shape-determining protein MreC [uncultured Gilvimarinus sp.]|uniref:rod shape-determining protein MreC n=1 Tax=uncultured Gilvimarinus sp. TaxID=1689143 RepID=UPI0030EC923B